MKKILIVLVCFLSLNCFSQYARGTTGTVVIISVWPFPYQCIGDSASISFTFKFNGTLDAVPSWHFHFMTTPNNITIRDMNYAEFYSLPKQFNGTDTIYTFKYLTPNTFSVGTQLSVSCSGDILPNSLITGKNVNMQPCTIAGIEEHSPDSSTPIYLDIYGRPTTLKSGEFIIKETRVGNKIIRTKLVMYEAQ